MYIPQPFTEPSVEIMHELIRVRPLATVVTLSSEGLNANHIPLHLSPEPAPLGALRGHIARANPLWRDFSEATGVLAIFHGPEAYITPSWYATKQVTGKVVPTWNYAVVHAYGTLKIMDDPDWIRAQLEALTAHNEAAFAEPWQLAEAPHEFTETLIGAVVGVEIVMTKLLGKWKVSQNQPPQNQASLIRGLAAQGREADLAMAALVDAATVNKP